MKQFRVAALLALLLLSGTASAAQKQNPYQFDDVSGYPGGSGIGAQWVGLASVSSDFPRFITNSVGDSSRSQMQVAGDLLLSNKTMILVSADAHRGDLFNTAFFVIPEGKGSLSVNFAYNGSGSEPVTLGVYGANFENTYPSIASQPTPGGPNAANVTIEAVKKQGTERVYESAFGELIFHQNPTATPSQSTHVPFVIANVHDGDASGAPLAIKSTTRSVSGDIVGRRWFDWTVQADKTAEPTPIDWIFVPIWDEVIDQNPLIKYKFTTEVTNHSGIRYGVQRYDSPNNNLDAVHWKFDLQPIPDRLPATFQLDKLSHIVPGLVTVYSHDASVTPGQQNLLRLAAVDPLQLRGSKALQLRYRTIYGYNLGSVSDSGASSFWTLTAYRAYPSATDFFKRALQAMDVSDVKYVFPERSADILAGAVSNAFVTADALSSFKISAPVPGWSGPSSEDLSPGMLGLNVTLRIPKENRLIAPLWDAFAASRNLTNDFAKYFSVWFRSPKNVDLDLSKYLMEESKYDSTVKVFLDEERACVTVQYLLLLVEGNERGRDRKPRIRIVSDTTAVNNYNYIVVDDGIDDGKWEMTFFAAPITPVVNPDPVIEEGGGGGCSTGLLRLSLLLLIPLFFRKKFFRGSAFLITALLFCSSAYAAAPATVSYEQDLPAGTQGSLRWAIAQVNAGLTDTVMFNNLSSISLAAPALVISSNVIIEGNGTMIINSGAGRLFEVISGANVTFRALTFNGGEPASGNGGAVLVTSGIVKFDKCTFSENSASNGGAVYADGTSRVSFTNCTFYSNRSTADGGAAGGGIGSDLSFAFVTMYGNNAGGAGEGACAKGTSSFLASVFVGNGTNSNDVYTSGASISQGYNAVGNDILPWPAGEGDLMALSAADIFSSNPTPDRNYAAPDWRNWPLTIALLNRSMNPVLDVVPETVLASSNVIVDQRYVMRAQGSSKKSSAGAYEVYTKDPPITNFQIGGLPNGIATVGFSSLLATSISPANANPGITWGPSPNPEIYEVTPYGKIWVKGKGNSILKATSDGYDSTGTRKSISIPIIVKYSSAENPGYTLPDPNAETAENKKEDENGGGGCNGGVAALAAFFVAALAVRKLKTLLLSVVLISALSFSADAASFTAAVSPSSVTLKPGATASLSVATPSGTFTYLWSSGSTSVASVDAAGSTGTVTAVSNGTTNITCTVTSSDGSVSEDVSVTCSVKVLKPATSIDISSKGYFTSISGSIDITVTIEPSDAESADVEWSILTAGTSATITPKDATKATFTAVSFPGPNSSPFSSLPIPYNSSTKNPIRVVAKLKYWEGAPVSNDSCDVIINPIPITSATVSPKLISLDGAKPNDNVAVALDPVNATMTSADWFSSNSLAVGITSPSSALTNTVVGKKQGESKVRYIFSGWLVSADYTHSPLFASDDSTVICVSPPPPIGVSQVDITDPEGNLKLQSGLSYQFVAIVIPYNAEERNLVWTTDNPLAATVNNGYVTAVYPGTAVIKAASASNPKFSASRTVTVVAPPSTGTDTPSTVEITPDIANKIEAENEQLRRSGCEVNFGFMNTNKPHESSLTSYGQAPKIISALAAAPQISIAPVPNVVGVFGSSAKIELDVSSYGKAGQTAILPVSLKFMITASDIRTHIGGDVSAIIADPYSNLDLLFRTFSIKKQIIDPTPTNNLAPMIPNVISAQSAARSGILILKSLGDKIEITLNYYVSDSANTFASVADGNIAIGDGAANGIIRDPVWVVAPAETGGGGGSDSGGGGGGCNAAFIAFGALLLLPLMKRR